MNKRTRRRLGEAAWRELLGAFEQGGETVEAFCRRHGVSKNTFNRWRARLQPAPTPSPREGFMDLGAMRAPMAGAGRLEITLDLGGGVKLHMVRA